MKKTCWFSIALLMLAAPGVAGALDTGPPVIRWDLKSDLLAKPTQGFRIVVDGLEKPGAFNGRQGSITVGDTDALDFGTSDFSISTWINPDMTETDGPGDLLAKFDAVSRTGFQLGIMNNSGTCSSMANTRNLFFGIDQARIGEWKNCGRPGDAILVYALCVFDGALYASTYEDKGGKGRVYRYDGKGWVDCGAPGESNSVTALAIYEGKLYAGTARYNASGSHLPASTNLTDGGKVFRYDGGTNWTDCGKVGETEFIFGMHSFEGKLYASLMDSPNKRKLPKQGLYRYEGGTQWTYCNDPEGRVAAIAPYNGKLYGTGYDAGDNGGLYRYEGEGAWSNYGPPPMVEQTYSFAFPYGDMVVGTWPEAKVWRMRGPRQWEDLGRLGLEQEVMGMAIYNGMLYGGTLPLAEVYRYDQGTTWTLTGRLDFSDVEYRRAWSMAVYDGKLFCGVLPSGTIHSLQAGAAVTYDKALEGGWQHVAAVRAGNVLKLYLDGKLVAESDSFDPGPLQS
jgi:hypothetical protein